MKVFRVCGLKLVKIFQLDGRWVRKICEVLFREIQSIDTSGICRICCGVQCGLAELERERLLASLLGGTRCLLTDSGPSSKLIKKKGTDGRDIRRSTRFKKLLI